MIGIFMLEDTRWMDEGACYGRDPDIFANPERVDEAKKLCRTCVSYNRCATEALARVARGDDFDMVQAGMTMLERAQEVSSK